jgi:tRNA pseudouridine13 synthase
VAVFAPSPETFVVEEIPAYLPQGAGPHTYLWIEKRGLTTPEAVRRLARALGLRNDRDVGYAGLKDRHATTRQWISVPDVTPEQAQALAVDGVRVLEARRHGNKLRVGHLRGNRFEVVLTEVGASEAAALAAALAGLAADGLPNPFGAQRFGAAGDNVASGLAVLRGERRERDGRRRRFLLSSVQSEVFNRVLAARASAGGLRRVLRGDVLQKVVSGGLFTSDDPAADQPRVDAGELVPTGPLPGTREIEPPIGTEARRLEDEALAAVGATREQLAALGRELPGARRPLYVPVTLGEPATTAESGALRMRFTLPSGSYATVLVEALAARVPPGEAVLSLRAHAAD